MMYVMILLLVHFPSAGYNNIIYCLYFFTHIYVYIGILVFFSLLQNMYIDVYKITKEEISGTFEFWQYSVFVDYTFM